jgi:hypothetical protein
MAELPEQKVHLGRGPRWVVVSWVARGLRKMEGGKYFEVGGGSCWTVVRCVNVWVHRDFGFRYEDGGALTVAHVVVKRHVFATGLQGSSIPDHFCVESIEIFMRNGVFDDDESIFVKASYGFLQVA